jgi:hypothetical protein
MEKNKKDKKKAKSHKKNNSNKNATHEYLFGSSIFDYDELTMLVLSHLAITELIGVRSVCKKWNELVYEPTIWKGVLLSTFGAFLGPEYRNIIKDSSGADLLKAVQDPTFARTLFQMDKNFESDEKQGTSRHLFGLPRLMSKTALIDHLFSDKPIWRSPWLTNNKSKTNEEFFLLPNFQPHYYPAADSLFAHVFFYVILERSIDGREFWEVLEQRAKSPANRPKAIALICTWLANYNWKKYSSTLDPLLEQFLETATNDERAQIEQARHFGVLSKAFDWQTYDQTYKAKLGGENLKNYEAKVKPKLLQQPINMMDIPPREMAKQIALCEQKHFREHMTLEYLIQRRWANTEPPNRFNKISSSLSFWILQQPTYDKRCEAVSYLHKLGYELIQLRCVAGAMLTTSCVAMPGVYRLLSTKKAAKKCAKEEEEVNRIVTTRAGYKELRNFMQESIGQATVPYLGITLTNLTFNEEGSIDYTEDKVNLEKWCNLTSIVCNIMQYQFVPYLYEPVEPLQQLWEGFAMTQYDEEKLYKYSLNILPRKAEKENDAYTEHNADGDKK